jgi:hypothetical protein
MNRLICKIGAASFGVLLAPSISNAQVRTLDQFENLEGWTPFKADGVNVSSSLEAGVTGKAIRFDYDFTKGTGYGGIQKRFAIDLPDNYEFSFYLKAESPANNFEIKFLDSTGNDVWWVNNRNFTFPGQWKKIRIKKRHIQFAWGPTADQHLHRVERIEFTVASFVGGKGILWIDDLNFEPLPPENSDYSKPTVTASSALKEHAPNLITDGSADTFWQSQSAQDQDVLFDFTRLREFGGLQISWLKAHSARRFEVWLSRDDGNWEKVYAVEANRSDTSFIRLPEAEARYLKLHLAASNDAESFGIADVKFLDIRDSLTMNDFLLYAAKHSPPGNYPRYCSEQASYWTVTGVNNDVKEGLVNEDGMVEVDKGLFSLEPIIKLGDRIYNWGNVQATQSMGRPGKQNGFDFVPSVSWPCGDLKFVARVMSAGQANVNSTLGICYEFQNLSPHPMAFDFYILIRPFQVNPYYQTLNLAGGAGKIHSLKAEADGQLTVDDKTIISQRRYDAFGAATFDEGNVVDLLRAGTMPPKQSATDPNGQAQGVIKYSLRLEPGSATGFLVAVPFYEKNSVADQLAQGTIFSSLEASADFWRSKVSHIKFNLPPSADRIVNTYRANLAYILVNRDKAGIQPGSRSYERSWIRDGALTSSALLKSGIVAEVKDFIDWYAPHQFGNGKVPCVVDARGPDPVPENDSCGEFIFLIREYFNFTHDTAFLRSKNRYVLKAVEYLESLIAQRSTDGYKNGDSTARACYGLVPESISHEGYSAKPMHSYWDDFFTLKGLKDAAEIQRILGETEHYERIKKVRDTFQESLYKSLRLAMTNKQINYLPGCVELGDFDATSTTIALTPCNELINLPKPQVSQTFDRYYDFFQKRRDGQSDWVNYTPYENRLIGSFILLDQPERAHDLITFFLKDQRPAGWYQWAEVVWKGHRTPRFIGDMPHTWVGSDFINAIRTMFVYENESDQSLVLAAALYQDWIDAPAGMSVEHLPTHYGEISYSIKRSGSHYTFSITGPVQLPANGIKIKNFNHSRLPRSVKIHGVASKEFSEREIHIREMPAEVVIDY